MRQPEPNAVRGRGHRKVAPATTMPAVRAVGEIVLANMTIIIANVTKPWTGVGKPPCSDWIPCTSIMAPIPAGRFLVEGILGDRDLEAT